MINLFRFISSHPLTKNSKLKSCFRVLFWQLRSRLADEVIVPWISGTKLAARHGMTGATGNIYSGLHEFIDMIFLLHFLREEDLFADIGANIGTYTILASGVCGARTIAFEPDPGTVEFLNRNISINSLAKLVTIQEVVVGAEEGNARFTVGLDTVNQVANRDEQNVRIVTQKRLDDMLFDHCPIMMKLDVEGYEEEVIRGAEGLLSNATLVAIELETVSEKTKDILKKYGFEKMYYDPYQRSLSKQPFEISSSNDLYIKDIEFARTRVKEAEKVLILDHLI